MRRDFEPKKDIFGDIPNIGDTIIFNPPKYKGLLYGELIKFTDAGCPGVLVEEYKDNNSIRLETIRKGFYSVKDQFVIKPKI